MVEIYRSGTEWTANQITLTRGSVDDIVSVGVHHATADEDPPTVDDFTEVTLVSEGDPLAEGDRVDVLALIGPRGDIQLEPGEYQRYVLVTTESEDIIRRVDTVEVL